MANIRGSKGPKFSRKIMKSEFPGNMNISLLVLKIFEILCSRFKGVFKADQKKTWAEWLMIKNITPLATCFLGYNYMSSTHVIVCENFLHVLVNFRNRKTFTSTIPTVLFLDGLLFLPQNFQSDIWNVLQFSEHTSNIILAQ